MLFRDILEAKMRIGAKEKQEKFKCVLKQIKYIKIFT